MRAVDPRRAGTPTASPRIAPLLQSRVVTLADAAPMVEFLFVDEPAIDEASWDKAMKHDWAAKLLDEVIATFEHVDVGARGPARRVEARSPTSSA